MLQESPLAHKRAEIARAALQRKRHPDDPEVAARVEELRAEYKAQRLEGYIRELMAKRPPLTQEQRDRLSLLLNGAAS